MKSLLDPTELQELATAGDIVILDTSAHPTAPDRDAHSEYADGHIPGARFLDLASLVDEASDVPKALPSPAQFAERMTALGVTRDSKIILYDDSAARTACRAWYMLRLYGLTETGILDGGLAAWREAGLPLEQGMPRIGPAQDFQPCEHQLAVRTKAELLADLSGPSEQIVDARDAGRFSGKIEDHVHGLPSGHIPGACNLPFGEVMDESGRFLSVPELRRLFRDTGLDLTRPIVTTCGSGVTACVLLFALHLAGVDDAALYDGSWLEWGSDPATPKSVAAD